MSIAEKLTTIAENQQKVFDAGKSEVVNELKERQKREASGDIVVISDVSTVEHDMTVKLSSDTVTDFSTTTLSTMGKNLIKFFDASLLQNITYETSSGETRAVTGFLLDKLKGGKSYTISFDFKDSSNICTYLYFIARDKDTNKATMSSVQLTTTRIEKKSHTFVAQGNQDYIIYRGGSYDLTQLEINKFSSFQFEVGKSATEYEPYVEPVTYTPNANGIVEGVKSICPNMTLLTDTEGVMIEADYNKDMNLIFNEFVKE